MSQEKDKFSLWIVPKGEAGAALQALVNKLADENNSPRFVPHLTLVANIFASPTERNDVAARIKECTSELGPLTVKLTDYDYTEEEFRSLYLLADGENLPSVYEVLSVQFPQISTEHFQARPHMSVLYGKYPQSVKDEIIAANPVTVPKFTVDSFDLYLTDSPVKSWRLAQSFPLSPDIQ